MICLPATIGGKASVLRIKRLFRMGTAFVIFIGIFCYFTSTTL